MCPTGQWRRQYISTFSEGDITQLGITIPARTLRRFWCIHGPPAGAVGDEHRETRGAETQRRGPRPPSEGLAALRDFSHHVSLLVPDQTVASLKTHT